MMNLLLLLPSLICTANAFTPAHFQPRLLTRLFAAGGAPQYEKVQATLREAEQVGDGSVMLHIDTQDKVDYEPGHVIALEIQGDVSQDGDSKLNKDTRENGGWMRGPYTISRATDKSIDILVRVVGDKSKRFASANPGEPIQFGGKFKVPILDGISTDSTKRVVMISTGVGVGPCIGAIEKAMGREDFPPIDLVSNYRTEAEVVYRDHLNNLQKEQPNKFSWKAIITSEKGRISASDDNLKAITETKFDAGLENTHFHLIGNGQLVSEFKKGLQLAGVPDEKVTVEMYFNHKAEIDNGAVERIAAAIKELAYVGVTK